MFSSFFLSSISIRKKDENKKKDEEKVCPVQKFDKYLTEWSSRGSTFLVFCTVLRFHAICNYFHAFLCNNSEGMDEWKTTLRGAQLNRTPLRISGKIFLKLFILFGLSVIIILSFFCLN